MTDLDRIYQHIIEHPTNQPFTQLGLKPLYLASPSATIVIIGQAPGIKAQQNNQVWSDASGTRLISWLGIEPQQFRDPSLIAHLPMDFYYPGKGTSGDLPPRKDFAPLWHKLILDQLPKIELMIVIGQYAHKHYLGKHRYSNLTETVRNYNHFLPLHFPLVHPSPLNFRWFRQNPWFEEEVIPALQQRVRSLLPTSSSVN